MTQALDWAVGSAPGKVILFGEHAVVYGRRAVAASIAQKITARVARVPMESTPPIADERLAAAIEIAAQGVAVDPRTLAIEIESGLPAAVGLGSSAALGVALVRALANLVHSPLGADECAQRAFAIEKIFHGSPSGIDNTISAHGGLISFSQGEGMRKLDCARALNLVVAIGRQERQTGRVVAALRQRWTEDRPRYEAVFDRVEEIVTCAERALGQGDEAMLGELMDANHRLLAEMGVSTDELDEMTAVARRFGSLGAKLTGGGGGGAIIALSRGDANGLLQGIVSRGWRAFATTIGGEMCAEENGGALASCA